jgi:ABC-2 type transport system ATP-binding protein
MPSSAEGCLLQPIVPQRKKITMMTTLIQTHQLTKRYDDRVLAVDRVTFQIHRGEIFGLLGPNGAGKTTTIKLLNGLARPTSGSARIQDVDIQEKPKTAQGLMGVVPDESNLYPELSGFENLSFCGALYGLGGEERRSRARQLLRMFDLETAGGRKFQTYSKGMKRKLTIAAGIIHRPPILFLDEPTTGIDVNSARQIRKLILDLRKEGVTILLTTHYIEEAERLCDRIGFLVGGQLIKVDSVQNLLAPVQNEHILVISVSRMVEEHLETAARRFPGYHFSRLPGDRLEIVSNHPVPVSPIVRFLEDLDITVLEAVRARPSLEEVFVRLTGVARDDMMREKNQRGRGK